MCRHYSVNFLEIVFLHNFPENVCVAFCFWLEMLVYFVNLIRLPTAIAAVCYSARFDANRLWSHEENSRITWTSF